MSGEYMGWEEYLFVAAETTWKTKPATPTYIFVPVESYGVRFRGEDREVRPHTGGRQRVHKRRVRGMLTGQIVLPFFGKTGISQFFFDKALSAPAGSDLDSFMAEWAQGGVDDKEHLGLRINQLTLAGNASDGVKMTLDCIGAKEANCASPQAIPEDQNWDDASTADLEDCSFLLAGGAAMIEDFSVTVANSLKAEYQGKRELQLLKAGPRIVDYSVTLARNANTYDLLRRATGAQNEQTGQLVVKALQEDASTYTVLTIDFGRLNFNDDTDQGGLEELIRSQVAFQVLKPDSADDELEYAFSSV